MGDAMGDIAMDVPFVSLVLVAKRIEQSATELKVNEVEGVCMNRMRGVVHRVKQSGTETVLTNGDWIHVLVRGQCNIVCITISLPNVLSPKLCRKMKWQVRLVDAVVEKEWLPRCLCDVGRVVQFSDHCFKIGIV